MKKILGSNITKLNNIPKNAYVGYGGRNSGIVHSPDGQFVMYGRICIDGSDGKPIIHSAESDTGYTVTFSEIPCDAAGNNLMEHYEMSTVYNDELSGDGPYFLQLTIYCKKEPTHRINTATGNITSNDSDGEYIKDMVLSYLVIAR